MKEKNRLAYEREPEPEIEFDEIEDEGEEMDYLYEGYTTFELTIAETMEKKVRVYARDAKTAEAYITEQIGVSNIQMQDIDSYKKTVTVVEEAPGEEAEYTVPLYWYEDDDV